MRKELNFVKSPDISLSESFGISNERSAQLLLAVSSRAAEFEKPLLQVEVVQIFIDAAETEEELAYLAYQAGGFTSAGCDSSDE